MPGSRAHAGQLNAELERALLHALAHAWDTVNYQHFRNALRRPVLGLHDGGSCLGSWNLEDRSLSFSRDFVSGAPWTQVKEVLKHEMAHQYAHEVLGATTEPPHGPTFQQVCAQHGFDATAAGQPPGGPGEESPILRRIAKLLALAESPNLHEAEVAMKQAQRLMLKHNVESAAAAAREGYSFRHVGVPKARRTAAEKALANLLERFFFVLPIWVPYFVVEQGKDSWILELCGSPSNLDVAAWVHDFLTQTAERLWKQHKRAHGIRSDADRRLFVLGVMRGFSLKLNSGVVETRQEGLVWKGDPQLSAYYHRRYPRRVSSAAASVHVNEAYLSGHRAGQEIVLSRPVTAETKDRGHLLTSGG